MSQHITGNIVDIRGQRIFEGEMIFDEKIISINEVSPQINTSLPFVLPGFIDAHVHIESSMLVPSEFARLAVVHGTVGTVSDPHEIANVCGMKGVEFMIANGKTVNFKFNFGAPSCVPATIYETAGDTIDGTDIEILLSNPEIKYLSEMMNFPGVIFNDGGVMKKIEVAHKAGKPVDGHAPGLRGEPLKKYVSAGISTDHECFTAEEALDKLKLGMKIIIREGSAAKNFEALIGLLHEYPDSIMFCSDDKHPDSLVASHINELCTRAVTKGIDIFNVLKAACINPVEHYKLDIGTLQINDPSDFIIVNDLKTFKVIQTFVNGECVAENGKSLIVTQPSGVINNFSCEKINEEDIVARERDYVIENKLPVIEALDGQLITHKLMPEPRIKDGLVISDTANDILKIVVVNRYQKAKPAIAFIKNFGLRTGAIASSVAHDSHNIIAIGVNDQAITQAINLLIEQQGGVSCVTEGEYQILSLPVAGLMSNANGYIVAEAYTEIDRMAKTMGSKLSAPFMTLSFMALLVIPSLKLSDKGLFDGDKFSFVYNS